MATNDVLVERLENLRDQLEKAEERHRREMEKLDERQESDREKSEASIRWIWRVLIGIASIQGLDLTKLLG